MSCTTRTWQRIPRLFICHNSGKAKSELRRKKIYYELKSLSVLVSTLMKLKSTALEVPLVLLVSLMLLVLPMLFVPLKDYLEGDVFKDSVVCWEPR